MPSATTTSRSKWWTRVCCWWRGGHLALVTKEQGRIGLRCYACGTWLSEGIRIDGPPPRRPRPKAQVIEMRHRRRRAQ